MQSSVCLLLRPTDPDHYLSSCLHVSEYTQKGLFQKNPEGQIVLPNGNRINMRELPGQNLKERIDNWHKNKPMPQVFSNFVGSAFLPTYAWTDDEPITPEVRSKLSPKELEELEVLENLVSSTQKKIDCAKGKQGANWLDNGGLTTRAKAQAAGQEKAVPAVPAERSSRPDPQFRYITPIEDKDQLVTKRVVTSAFQEKSDKDLMTEVFNANVVEDQDHLIVAKHVEELRVIDILIHRVKVLAVIDDGSQIVSIRQDIWEKIGLPIRSDRIMVMESANKTKDETMSLLQDLKINIGGYNFYLQVQVVREAPYEMLLGMPFYTLTSADHKHFENGDSRLTLLNPNTGEKITIPT